MCPTSKIRGLRISHAMFMYRSSVSLRVPTPFSGFPDTNNMNIHSANCTLEKDWNCSAVESTAESAIVSAPEGIVGAPSVCVRDTCAELKPGALNPESATAAAAAVTGM